MNKPELIAAAAEKAGITKKDAERVLNAALDTIAVTLARGGRVQLTGVGTFEVKDREPIPIPATKAPVFKPSAALKEIVGK